MSNSSILQVEVRCDMQSQRLPASGTLSASSPRAGDHLELWLWHPMKRIIQWMSKEMLKVTASLSMKARWSQALTDHWECQDPIRIVRNCWLLQNYEQSLCWCRFVQVTKSGESVPRNIFFISASAPLKQTTLWSKQHRRKQKGDGFKDWTSSWQRWSLWPEQGPLLLIQSKGLVLYCKPANHCPC